MRAILALGMVLTAANAQSSDPNSGNFMLPYCKEFISTDRPIPPAPEALFQGLCAGMVDGIAYTDIDHICRPDAVTVGQMVRVVIAYIEARPARMHERFKALAEEAMANAWPCPVRR